MVIQNRIALGYWFMCGFFTLILTLLTYTFMTKGTPSGYHPLLFHTAFALFWSVLLFLLLNVLKKPIVTTVVSPQKLNITVSHLMKKELLELSREAILHLDIVVSKDSEGDDYFELLLTTKTHTLTLFESHTKEEIETTKKELESILTS